MGHLPTYFPSTATPVHTINFPIAVTLGGANDGGGASIEALQTGHVVYCSGR